MSVQPPAAGWYPDPWYPGAVRWFDGAGWTEHAAAGGGYPGYVAGAPYDGVKGASSTRWGRVGFVLRGIGGAGMALLMPALYGGLMHGLFGSLGEETAPKVSSWYALVVLVFPLSLLAFAGLVLVIIWSHRATVNARALGVRTTFGPGMAIGGWLIPYANFVLPYLIVRDLFPEDSPERSMAGFWWGCEMGGSVLLMFAYGMGLAFGTGAGVAAGLVPAAVLVAAAILGRRLCEAADRHQAELAAAQGWT